MTVDTGVETDTMMTSGEGVIVAMIIDTEKGDVARPLNRKARGGSIGYGALSLGVTGVCDDWMSAEYWKVYSSCAYFAQLTLGI